MGNSTSTPAWDPHVRGNYDIWPNIVDYYERHKAEGCDLAYMLIPLRVKIERFVSDMESGQENKLIKPVNQPKYLGKERQWKLRDMRASWMFHSAQEYKEADLKLNLESPKIVVDQYRDFKLQGRDTDYVDPVLRRYCEEQLALREPEEDIYEGFPPLKGPQNIPHGHRFGEHGVRSKWPEMEWQEGMEPEGWRGGRPLPIPSWMTGNVSSFEVPPKRSERTESIRKALKSVVGRGDKGWEGESSMNEKVGESARNGKEKATAGEVKLKPRPSVKRKGKGKAGEQYWEPKISAKVPTIIVKTPKSPVKTKGMKREPRYAGSRKVGAKVEQREGVSWFIWEDEENEEDE